jgi:hypothetical protein
MNLSPTFYPVDGELLADLSISELRSLSTIALSPSSHNRLNHLNNRASKNQLSARELQERDRLLLQAKILQTLQRSAKYTLSFSNQ